MLREPERPGPPVVVAGLSRPPRPRVVGVVQARIGSTRLPRKALLQIAGRPMVLRVWERLRLCREIDAVVAAIPDTTENDTLAAVLDGAGVAVSRGPEEAIPERLWAAGGAADAIVRVTGDEPLVDPALVDDLVRAWRADPALDYVSNVYPERRWPEGLDAEVMAVPLLGRLAASFDPLAASSPSEWLWIHPECMRYASRDGSSGDPDLWRLHWSVDTAEDLEGARRVWERLPEGFAWQDVIEAFGRRGLAEIGKLS